MFKELLYIIDKLWEKLAGLQAELSTLRATLGSRDEEIEVLKALLFKEQSKQKKNSRNSSKPPSSDKGRKKNKNNRPPSDKSSGAQPGNSGATLNQVEKPDDVLTHSPKMCDKCGADVSDAEVVKTENRQEFDMIAPAIKVTEHQAQIVLCSNCGCEVKADFPVDIKAPVQYGPHVKAAIVDLNVQHFLSYERIQLFFQNWLGHRISGGLIRSSLRTAKTQLSDYEQHIREKLLSEKILHSDETGVYVTGRKSWLHVLCTSLLTLYQVHPNRGSQAINDLGILPEFTGLAVHDGYKTYQTYNKCQHALCHAHHLRELIYFHEEEQAIWAYQMTIWLRSVKRHRDQLIEQGTRKFSKRQIELYRRRYLQIIRQGLSNAPPDPPRKSNRGRAPKHPQRNLLDRLYNQQAWMLAFVYDFDVPFDNNQAERDLRMVKTKQKVSGTFRTQQGAEDFAAVRGYISTAKKNQQDILEAIAKIFYGEPFMP